jgi:arsenate reductase (thioredoxin)
MSSARLSLFRGFLAITVAAFIGCAPLTPALHGPQSTGLKPVLFVCEHGVAKSALAAALFNDMAEQRGLTLRAERRSASTPQVEPSLSTNKGMAADGLPIPVGVPLQLSERDIHSALRVVTIGTSLPLTVREITTEDWADVPAVGDGYASARDMIRRHISQLLDDLAAHPAGSSR